MILSHTKSCDFKRLCSYSWACVIFLLLISTSYAEKNSVSKAKSLMDDWPTIRQNISLLHKDYLDAAIRTQKNRFEIKLTEARVHYLTEDYRSAAMILLSLVDNYQGNKNSKNYHQAVFYLADSLYHIGNLDTANKFFLQVLKFPTAQLRPCTLGRLLEISLLLKQPSLVQKYQTQAIQAVEQLPDSNLLYLLGKYSYQIEQYKEAEMMWSKVQDKASIYPQALYSMAVALLQQRKIQKSLTVFEQVSKLNVEALRLNREKLREQLLSEKETAFCTFRSNQKQLADEKGWEQIIGYAELAMARIYYEQKKYSRAMDHYLAIDRDSLAFRDATKESVWVAIKQEEFEQALERLDVQLIDQPIMINDPMTRILQGKLLSIVGRFDDARSLFQEVKSRFEMLKKETLTPILRKARGQLISYYQKKLAQGIGVLNLESLIPKRARIFTEEILKNSRARSLFVEVDALNQDLIKSRQDIKKLKWMLEGSNQSEIFPTLQEGLLHSIELEYTLLQLQRELNDRGGVAESDIDYVSLRKERDRLHQNIKQLPQNKMKIEEREAKVERELMITDLHSYRLSILLRNLQAELVALERFLQDHKVDQLIGAITPKKRKRKLREVKQAMAENKSLQEKVRTLSELINFTQLRVGLYDETFLQEQKQRHMLEAALDLESEWLISKNRFPNRMLDALQKEREIIKDFQQKSVTLVKKNTSSLKEQVRLEEKKIIIYEKQLARLSRKAKALGGQIVAEAFYHVLQSLNRFILEADAGLLNVFWQQKQNGSQQLGGIRSRRRQHLSILKRDIVDVSK